MIQIWKCVKISEEGTERKEEVIISVQDTMENAKYFCKKNRIRKPKLIKVSD